MVKRCLLGVGLSLSVASYVQAQDLAHNDEIVSERVSDSTFMKKEPVSLHEVQVMGRSKIRKLKESAMPVSVIGERQLQGTANNINDVLARTVGITIRNTGGLGSALCLCQLQRLRSQRDGKPISQHDRHPRRN